MKKFTNFIENFDIHTFNKDKPCIVDIKLFENMIQGNNNFAIVIIESNNFHNLKNNLKNSQRFYPLIIQSTENYHSYLVFEQKMDESEEDFKFRINKLYENFHEQCSVVYVNSDKIKVLHELNLLEFDKKYTVDFFEKQISEIIKENITILGIEIPTEKNLIEHYRKNNYIVPHLLYENNTSWRKLIK